MTRVDHLRSDPAAGSDPPTLSVVIPTRVPSVVTPVLEALVPQVRAVGGEVIVVVDGSDDESDDGSDDGCAAMPPVRWIAVKGKNLLRLRSLGIQSARGAVVAISEDHALPTPGWAQAVLRAHGEYPDIDAVVGCLVNATQRTITGRANFLAFAAPYTPPMPSLPARRPPPSSTLSFKCETLADLDDTPGSLEAVLIPRLFVEGRMVADDRIVTEHYQDHGVLWSIANSFYNTRSHYGYAGAGEEAPRRREVARWVAGHVAPRLWHEALEARRLEPGARKDLLLVAALVVAAAAGGVVGTVSGPGHAPERAS